MSIVGFAVLIILLFWMSKFKRTWFKSKKKEVVEKKKTSGKKTKEEAKAERLESSDQYDDENANEVEMKVSTKKKGNKYRELK